MNRRQIEARIRDLEAERDRADTFGPGDQQTLDYLNQQLADADTAATKEAEAIQANLPTGVTADNLSRFVETDADGNPIVKVDATTNQKYYDIREDLAGGEITDRRLGLEGVNTGVTSEQLTTRADAREKGFQGDMRDDLAGNFVTDDAGRRGLVDPFGYQSALGQQKDIIDDPAGTMPAGATYTPEMLDASAPGTTLQADQFQLGQQQVVDTALAQAQNATQIAEKAAREYNATTAFNQVSQQNMQAEQINRDIRMIQAQQAEVEERSTVRGQLGMLMQDFQGDQVPAWASASVRKAEQIMAARGLGASTIAGRSVAQAVMEAALPIAQQDASTFAQFQQLNLNNRQQAELQNAANLLTVDIKNLDTRQQTAVLNTQNRVQALFTDQSEINTSRKINAASANQTQQFFSGLQRTAISQFNAGAKNAVAQFNAQTANQRDMFNVQNKVAIEQANAVWRRAVNTANTAAVNAKNQFDAVNVLNRSNTALNNYMMVYRDNADYNFQAGQNAEDRAMNTAIASLRAGSGSGKSPGFFDIAAPILGSMLSNWAATAAGGTAIGNVIGRIPIIGNLIK
jgi:hypothetical protein